VHFSGNVKDIWTKLVMMLQLLMTSNWGIEKGT